MSFSHPAESSGVYSVTAGGTYSVTDVVTDLREDMAPQSCWALDWDTVTLAPLNVAVDLTPTCDLTLPYSGDIEGRLGVVSCRWAWGGGDVTAPQPPGLEGRATVAAPGGTVSATLSCQDRREDDSYRSIGEYVCSARGANTAQVLAPVQVSISPGSESLSCQLNENFSGFAADVRHTAVRYRARAVGGSGAYRYAWQLEGPAASEACGDASFCTVDTSESDACALVRVQATVKDESELCPLAESEVETLTKLTLVQSTDQ
jgi:hypothetical protein